MRLSLNQPCLWVSWGHKKIFSVIDCLKMTILGEIGHFQACRQGSPRVAKGCQGPRGTQGWVRWVITRSIIFKLFSYEWQTTVHALSPPNKDFHFDLIKKIFVWFRYIIIFWFRSLIPKYKSTIKCANKFKVLQVFYECRLFWLWQQFVFQALKFIHSH